MVTIITPPNLTPFDGPVVFRMTSDATTEQSIDLTMYDADNGTLLAGRRLHMTGGEASFDAAPILRRMMKLQPSGGESGLFAADDAQFRIRLTAVESGAAPAAAVSTDNNSAAVSGAATIAKVLPPDPPEEPEIGGEEPLPEVSAAVAELTTVCRATADGATGMLTSMPARRTIRHGESDRLLIYAPEPFAAEVEALADDGSVQTASYEWQGDAGMAVLRLRTSDFGLHTRRLTVRIGGQTAVQYDLEPAGGSRTVRLAWRTDEGSVEHYTFPVMASRTLTVGRNTALLGGAATVTSVSRGEELALRSQYEPQATARALARIAASAQVWLVDDERGIYEDAVAVESQMTTERFGEPVNVELTVRPSHKTTMS